MRKPLHTFEIPAENVNFTGPLPTLERQLWEAIQRGEGYIIIDPHAKTVTTVTSSIVSYETPENEE